jgi:hypothetical protein
VIALVPAAARADDGLPPPQLMSRADTPKVCDAIRALPDGPNERAKCRQLATYNANELGTVDTYVVTSSDVRWTRYVLVMHADNETWLSPPIDVVEDGGMGKFDLPQRSRPQLHPVTVQGNAAMALEVSADYAHLTRGADDQPKPPKPRAWSRQSFAVCGKDAGGVMKCVMAAFGSPYVACRASITDDGTVRHACEDRDDVSFDVAS